MELLLLLTALFASLTGTGSGDRQLRQVQGVAVVHAAQVAQAAAQPARAVMPMAQTAHSLRRETVVLRPASAVPLVGQHFPFERRLE
ncbi:MAG: hypothetical protein EOP62_08625 [Sphingomonadales bacterium]|nr:MAG: hypothetical protein EOP62_08625 [Sphingomonadales bacterium]